MVHIIRLYYPTVDTQQFSLAVYDDIQLINLTQSHKITKTNHPVITLYRIHVPYS
jgi:hypothetical protein